MLRYFKGLVLITLAATVGVLPLVAFFFHYVSLISPVANFIAGPLVSMALVPFSLLGAFAYLLTGYYITWPVVEVLAQATNWLAGSFASVPMASLHVPTFPLAGLIIYYAGFALWFWKRYRRVFLLIPAMTVIACILLLGVYSPVETDSMRVIFPDAGRADTAIIELPENSGTLVVDTGWRGSVAASYLRTRGIKDISVLILTHAHADHAGGAARLVRDFNVHEIWDAGWSRYDPDSPLGRLPRKSLKRGDVISGKGYEILVLHPYAGYESLHDGAKGVNDRSLVFRITGGGASYLFTADIGLDAVHSMSGLAPKWLSSDVIKAPHHGREPEALYTLLRRSRAKKLVITAPKVHKSIKDIKPLWPELDVLVTGMDGAISLSGKSGEIKQSLYAESMLIKSPTLSEEIGNLLKLFRSWP
jgi:competence protein ComEC